jgi:hypothetical protein
LWHPEFLDVGIADDKSAENEKQVNAMIAQGQFASKRLTIDEAHHIASVEGYHCNRCKPPQNIERSESVCSGERHHSLSFTAYEIVGAKHQRCDGGAISVRSPANSHEAA